MDVRQFAFLASQPSAALKNRDHFLGLPKRGIAFLLANVMFWQLKAHAELMVAGQGDVAVLSGVEEHGSYSKKTKSGFLGLSKSGKSQLKTTASQVGSELEAGNDVVVAAGNDVRLR